MSYTPPDTFIEGPSIVTTNALGAFTNTRLLEDSGLVGASGVISAILRLVFTEQAAPSSPGAGFGSLYLENDTPNRLALINDAGNTLYLPGLVGFASSEWGGIASTTSNIPSDNTIPRQSLPTEGTQFHSLSYTPISTDNVLLVIGTGLIGHSNASLSYVTMPLFKDSGADAVAVSTTVQPQYGAQSNTVWYTETVTATSSQTWKLRVGGPSTTYANQNPFAATQIFRSTGTSWLFVFEIAN